MNTTKKLIQILANSNDFISGQELADKLQVSRTAIWKAIKTLQNEGYAIESRQKSGYRLADNDKLSAALIKSYLPTDLQLDFEIHQSLNSTNTRAKELAAMSKLTNPLVIISEEQTAGYGRHGRFFSSPQKTGIYLSLLLNNTHTNFNPGLLTTAAAVAMHRTILHKLDTTAQIKWVNDLLLNNKKVCGILTEGIVDLESRSVSQIILGCGINYLTPLSSFDCDLKETVASLRDQALAKNVSRNEFIASFLSEFFDIYSNYQTASFMDEYRKNCYLLNHEVTITQGDKVFNSVAVNINDNGELVLANGQTLSSGEVTKIRPR
jgi:BirA family biotin operon repressor/biotin-[acetyl-CoA-carboxylase] ligase